MRLPKRLVKRNTERPTSDAFTAKHIEVSAEECGHDFNKMMKKLDRKIKKEELLKPFWNELAFYTTKGQKRRQAKIRGTYRSRKEEQKNQIEEIR